MAFTAEQALERAVRMGAQSPCEKSKRGVVVWNPSLFDILCAAYNHPPKGFVCDGSDACRENCGKHCVHAEMSAIIDAKQGLHGFHMLHVKVVDGEAVPSGPPLVSSAPNTSSKQGSLRCGFCMRRGCEDTRLKSSTSCRCPTRGCPSSSLQSHFRRAPENEWKIQPM